MKQSQPELVSLVYIDGPRTFQFQPGDVVYWVDGIERRFKSIHASEFLALITGADPRTVTFDQVFEHFRTRYSIGSPLNKEAGIHKIVHGLRQDLALAGLKMDLVQSVRGTGYRMAEGWKVEASHSSADFVQAEVQELRGLVARCVEYVRERPIQATTADLYYLDAESHVVQENFMTLDRISWRLLHSIGDSRLVPEILDIKRDLSLLMSYVVFWRVGHRITPEFWREDFEQETSKILGDLETRLAKVRHCLNGSGASVRALTSRLAAEHAQPTAGAVIPLRR